MNDVLYRMIDANFNRAREAFRVMEEFCRFGLNHAPLSARTKQSRHRLCEAIAKLDMYKLLCSRDTAGDVGRAMKVEGQLSRRSLEDCFTAAAKRASEALRALAESVQSIDPDIAAVMEQLRFEAYAIEKEALLKASAAAKWANVRLYVLINAAPQTHPEHIMSLARDCIEGGADCLQLRAKNLTDKQFLALARRFTNLCREKGTVSIINDRADIAVLSGADGVHLGQDEISVHEARQLAPMPLIIGISTHNMDELTAGLNSAPDYAAVGAAFRSPTKPDIAVAGLDYLKAAVPILNAAGTPHVAIGGINESNLPSLLEIGVKTIAVSAAACGSANPSQSCRSLKKWLPA